MCLSTEPPSLQAKTFLDYSQIKVDSYNAQTCTDAGRAKTHAQTHTKTHPVRDPLPSAPPLSSTQDRQVFADRRLVDITHHRHPPTPTLSPLLPRPVMAGVSLSPLRSPRRLRFNLPSLLLPHIFSVKGLEICFRGRQAGRQAWFSRARTHTHHAIAHLQTLGMEHFQQRRSTKTGHSDVSHQYKFPASTHAREHPAPGIPLSTCQPHSLPTGTWAGIV